VEHRKQHLPLIAVTTGLLALCSGCLTADATKGKAEAKKPDVTQPGVLPPPQDMVKPASDFPQFGANAPGGAVVPAGGVPPVAAGAPAPAPGASPLTKFARPEKKVPATDMAVAWQNRIAYLPDPSRNGAMGAGLAGQMYLFGQPNYQFVLADGTLTVDLIDETPRPAGQPAATPERWSFNKATLRNLKTLDETFGKSYVLFLPWPAYKPDITRVRISARYDPDNGHPLFSGQSVVTIDTSGPLGTQVWDGTTTTTPIGALVGRPQPLPGPGFVTGAPIPLGGPAAGAPPVQPFAPGPLPPAAMPLPPAGVGPLEPLPPFGIPVGQQ
jgi:hypothetical protein